MMMMMMMTMVMVMLMICRYVYINMYTHTKLYIYIYIHILLCGYIYIYTRIRAVVISLVLVVVLSAPSLATFWAQSLRQRNLTKIPRQKSGSERWHVPKRRCERWRVHTWRISQNLSGYDDMMIEYEPKTENKYMNIIGTYILYIYIYKLFIYIYIYKWTVTI